MSYKKGDRVRVFNQVGDDWYGCIVVMNKATARVKANSLPSGGADAIFTNHRDARTGDIHEYLVPFCDLMDPDVDHFNEAILALKAEDARLAAAPQPPAGQQPK